MHRYACDKANKVVPFSTSMLVNALCIAETQLPFAGSAYFGALAVRNVLEEMVEVPVHLELAADFAERHPPIFRDDVCCFVSHTGENPDVLTALQYCRTKGSLCVGFTNQVRIPFETSEACLFFFFDSK